MNIKKSFLVAFAAVTAVATVGAASVSAATLGQSGSEATDTKEVAKGQDASFEVKVEEMNIAVNVPADAAEEGEVTFHAAVVTDVDIQKAADDLGLKESAILDMYFTNADDAKVAVKDAKIQITTDKNVVYAYADGKLTAVEATYEDGVLTFTKAADVEYYVLAKSEDEKSNDANDASKDDTKKDNNNGTNNTNTTGDNKTVDNNNNGTVTTGDTATTTTVAVFAVMGLVALGTAIAASKMKKSSK